jgi:hypothetical protein
VVELPAVQLVVCIRVPNMDSDVEGRPGLASAIKPVTAEPVADGSTVVVAFADEQLS